jgi:hypothetical protein
MPSVVADAVSVISCGYQSSAALQIFCGRTNAFLFRPESGHEESRKFRMQSRLLVASAISDLQSLGHLCSLAFDDTRVSRLYLRGLGFLSSNAERAWLSSSASEPGCLTLPAQD